MLAAAPTFPDALQRQALAIASHANVELLASGHCDKLNFGVSTLHSTFCPSFQTLFLVRQFLHCLDFPRSSLRFQIDRRQSRSRQLTPFLQTTAPSSFARQSWPPTGLWCPDEAKQLTGGNTAAMSPAGAAWAPACHLRP